MLARHAVLDWSRVGVLLPVRDGKPEWVSACNRLLFDAVLWVARTGVPWRDLPERFGHWNSVWRRFDRGAKPGIWRAVFEVFPDPDVEWLILDSTVIRAPPCAAGAPKKRTAPVAKSIQCCAVAEADSAPKFTPP